MLIHAGGKDFTDFREAFTHVLKQHSEKNPLKAIESNPSDDKLIDFICNLCQTPQFMEIALTTYVNDVSIDMSK